MTETQGSVEGTVSSSAPAISSSSNTSHVSSPAPVQSNSASTERTFTQSEVNDIVGKRLQREAADRRPQDYQRQYEPTQTSSQNTNDQRYSQPSNNDDYLRKFVSEEVSRVRDQWMQDAQNRTNEEYASRTVNNFTTKIDAGKKKYDDFEKVTSDISFEHYPNVVQLIADHVGNGEDVMYDLAKNPLKMESLESMAMRNPNLAIRAAKELSKSLEENQKASNFRHPNEPLSQMKPANAGVAGGQKSVADYRRMYRV